MESDELTAQLKALRAEYHELVLENAKLAEQVAFWRTETRRKFIAQKRALLHQLADEIGDGDTISEFHSKWLREKADEL
jgi:hypothetical protein